MTAVATSAAATAARSIIGTGGRISAAVGHIKAPTVSATTAGGTFNSRFAIRPMSVC
jgi:hypothetical protein